MSTYDRVDSETNLVILITLCDFHPLLSAKSLAEPFKLCKVKCMKQKRGFTLIELVMVILITGILSVFLMPKASFFNNMDSAAAADKISSILSTAQKNAIASRRTIWIVTTASSLKACYNASCTQPVTGIGGDAISMSSPTGTGIVTSNSSFTFDGLGRPNATANVVITYFGRTVTVEQETGLIWSS